MITLRLLLRHHHLRSSYRSGNRALELPRKEKIEGTYVIAGLFLFGSRLVGGSLFNVGLDICMMSPDRYTRLGRKNPPSFPLRPFLSTWRRGVYRLRLVSEDVRLNTCLATRNKRPTEAGFWVLGLDSLAPVLTKEHVGRESTLRGLGVLFGFARGGLFYFFGSLALEKRASDELDASIRARRMIRL